MLAVAPLALALALAPREEPAPPLHDRDHLVQVRLVAKRELVRYIDGCDGSGSLAEDRDAERALAAIAGMLIIFVDNFPYTPRNAHERTEHLRDAVYALGRAFDCAPYWDKRHYLEDALILVKQRQREIAAEQRRDTHIETDQLAADSQRLTDQLAALKPPAPRTPPSPAPPSPAPPDPAPQPWPQPRWLEHLSLRLEIGVGRVHLRDPGPGAPRTITHSTFAVVPGLRIPLGARRRHLLGAGFFYGLHYIPRLDLGHDHAVHTLAARAEYGLQLVPRWLSALAAFEAGLQARTVGGSFGREQLGLAFALCTADEAVCVRLRHFWTLPGANSYMDAPVLALLSLDLFRIAALARSRRT